MGELEKHQDSRLVFRSSEVDREALLQEIREFIYNNLESRVRTVDVAKEFFVSVRTFNRRLKGLGLTYREIAESVRRDLAMDLLKNSNAKISLIARTVGYYDGSNFTKAFKNWTGMLPREYRREISRMG